MQKKWPGQEGRSKSSGGQVVKGGVGDETEAGRTDNSWGPQAIGDHGAPVSLPKLKKAYEKRYQEHLMGPPTDPGHSGSARVSKWSVRS
ncbi:unnamed protein product, partial [Staurois parvus]